MFTPKNFLVGVESVNDERHQLRNISREGKCFDVCEWKLENRRFQKKKNDQKQTIMKDIMTRTLLVVGTRNSK